MSGWHMLPGMMGELDDRELMARYRDGDATAFETLYERHKGPLYRYYLRQNLSEAIAAELFQDVWMKIIRARSSYRPTAGFSTWMYRIAHNCLIDFFRRSGRSIPTVDEGAFEIQDLPGADCERPDHHVAALEMRERFRAALAELPDAQREAFVLREEANLSVPEIAAVTGVSREAAKSRIRYAIARLRRALAED